MCTKTPLAFPLHPRSIHQSTVYQKAMRISTYALSGGMMTMGQITNHMSVDANNVMIFSQFLHEVWAVPFKVRIIHSLRALARKSLFKRGGTHCFPRRARPEKIAERGRDSDIVFPSSKFLGQFSRDGVGLSSLTSNLSDKQASKKRVLLFRDPQIVGGGGAFDIMSPTFQIVDESPPPPSINLI